MRALVGTVAVGLMLGGCGWFKSKQPEDSVIPKTTAQRLAERQQLQRTCASSVTYDRLKVVMFEKAAQIHGGRTDVLNNVEAASVVRMENPVVRSRDETLNVTVCAGQFVLELLPGAERAFNGDRRLRADVEYSAQQAVDGSGPVYQVQGVEPIVYRLATLGGRQQGATAGPPPPPTEAVARAEPVTPALPPPSERPTSVTPQPVDDRPAVGAQRAPLPRPPVSRPRPVPAPPPVIAPSPRPAPVERRRAGFARTSYDCGKVTGRVTTMICTDDRLAAADRAMSARYYRALADADPATRSALRGSVDRFLAFRNRCRDEACVAQTYADRIDEIRDIANDR